MKILLKGTNTLFSAKIRKLSFSKPCQGVRNYEIMNSQTILDINYIDFLTISAVFHNTSRIGASFYIYIIHKPIDFSTDFSHRLKILGHVVIGLK